MPDEMREKAGLKPMEDSFKDVDKLRELLSDLIEHLLRADRRAWNRVIDTYKDGVRPYRGRKIIPFAKCYMENWSESRVITK